MNKLSDARQIQVIRIQDLRTSLVLRFVVRDSTMNVVHVGNSNRDYLTQPESTAWWHAAATVQKLAACEPSMIIDVFATLR
jgi:hypothetical protein